MKTIRFIPIAFSFALVAIAAPLGWAQAPVITAITPPRQVVAKGQSLTLSVTATGAASYQWKRSGRPVAGATNSTYTISNASPLADNGWYQAVATNSSGSTTSATIFVLVAPAITQVIAWGSNDGGQATPPATLTDAIAIASSYHGVGVVALKAGGTVAMWGASAPAGLDNVVAVAAGLESFLALKADGTVVAWGANYSGQSTVPAGLSGVVGIAAGAYHAVAVKSDGTVIAWGSSLYGATAVPAGLSGVVNTVAGTSFSLALKSDGTVVGWGANGVGESTPPPGLTNVVGVAASPGHSLAVKSDGTTIGWGFNANGQTTIPTGLSNVAAVSAGNSHSLALKSDGTVAGWGSNFSGETTIPVGLNAVFAIQAGRYVQNSFAIRDASADAAPSISTQPASVTAFAGQDVQFSVTATAGTALLNYQWRKAGVNISGATASTLTVRRIKASDAGSYDVIVSNQLGSVTSQAATLTFNATSAVSTNLTGRQVITAGQSIALTALPAIAAPVTYQWRRNGRVLPGQTNANLTLSNTSWRDNGAYQVVATNATGSALSDPVWIVVAKPSQVVAYGLNSDTQVNVPAGLNNAVSVAAGRLHSMALKSDGTIAVWGDSGFGQRPAPAGLTDVVQIAAGNYHSMVLRSDGTVVTWGQLNFTPSGLSEVMGIAGGDAYGVALKFDGSVVAWDAVGIASDVPAGLTAVAVAANASFRMALKVDGTLVVWRGSAPPAGLADVTAIAAGLGHALALKADGTVTAWGTNDNGQSTVPSGLGDVVAIAAGDEASFAIKADGTVVTWGRFDSAQTEPVRRSAPAFGLAATQHALVLRDPASDTVPVIATHPTGDGLAFGSSKTFSVTATGGVLSYQWRRNGSDIVGATNSTHTIGFVDSSQAGSYDVVVSNYLGSVTSNTAVLAVGTLPSFFSHPSSQSVGLGGTVSLTYGASGTTPISAQWRKNGDPIAGATDAKFTLANFQSTDAGIYTVAVTNVVGTVVSNAATLTAVASNPPVITSQPLAGTLLLGNVGSFSVSASSAHAVSYQWRKNGAPIAGATTAVYVVGAVVLADSGVYDVVLTSLGGSVTSNPASLNVVSSQLGIATQPFSVTVAVNSPASFSVTASGTAPFTYQWRKNGVAIAGATNAAYNIAAASAVDTGDYTVLVMNGLGTFTSNLATLTVLTAPPTISVHPLSSTVSLGSTTSFSVTASSGGPLNYQWRKDGINVAGGNSILTLFNVQLSSAGSYDVVVTNLVGSTTSNSATLTVNAAPVITSQPVDAIVNQGSPATFTVVATGSPSPTYQWRKGTTNVSGATSATFAVASAQPADAGAYSVVVSNTFGSQTSNTAALTVNFPPTIVTHPANTSVNWGSVAVMSVAVTGVPAPTYQWRKGGQNVAGETASTISLAANQTSVAGDYDVVVTNSQGSVTSNRATLTVVTIPPSITTQPVGGTLSVGGSIVLSIDASGSPELAYQWRRNGVNLPGATARELGIPNAQTWDNGDYDVVVTNLFGTATSATVRLNVVPKPVSISARVVIGSGEPAIAAFAVEGASSKNLLLRVVGPGITPFGFTNVVPDPQIEVFNSAAGLITMNNDWAAASNASSIASTTAAVGAFGLASDSRDAAVLHLFAPGTYLVRATGLGGIGGVAYLELYDADLPENQSRIPFVAVRARVVPGDAIMVGGLASNGRGVRSYLIRAAGPALGLAGAYSNPALVVARAASLVGQNDDWDAVTGEGAAVTSAASRVTAFPYAAASRDAALVLTGNLHAGAHTVQVGGAGGAGTVLLELHDLDAARPLAFAPVVVSPPVGSAVAAGSGVSLAARAHGTPPLAYQWRKDGINIAGATAPSYDIASAQTSHGGLYTVEVTNLLGGATSLPALLTVGGANGSIAATHAVVGAGYNPGGTVTITNTLTFTGGVTGVGWNVTLPAGWVYLSDAGSAGQVKPAVGDTGALAWAWTTPPTSPVTFTYTLAVPATETGDRNLSATATVRTGTDNVQTVTAAPAPLTVGPISSRHGADTNLDGALSLFELTRVIELYNTRNGTNRTGCYRVDAGGEDGFNPDASRLTGSVATLARFHSADTRGASGGTPRDGAIDLFELTRVIELYNYRVGTTRTGQYRRQTGTEDGFAPGP